MSTGSGDPEHRIITWSGMTDPGRVRKNNEDAFLALAIDSSEVRYLGKAGSAVMDGCDFIFAVSDGMGGANSGEFASKTAVEQITRLLPRSFRARATGISAGFEDILQEVFQQIHSRMNFMGASYEDCRGMGATLSLCWIAPDGVRFGHIGDSRIYHLPKDGGIMQISHDHSQVGWLRRTGQITEAEARRHPRRNILNRALGAGHQFVEPQIGLLHWEPGDQILLCSDGLNDGLNDSAIERIIRENQTQNNAETTKAEQVTLESIDHSGKDNTTTLIVSL